MLNGAKFFLIEHIADMSHFFDGARAKLNPSGLVDVFFKYKKSFNFDTANGKLINFP